MVFTSRSSIKRPGSSFNFRPQERAGEVNREGAYTRNLPVLNSNMFPTPHCIVFIYSSGFKLDSIFYQARLSFGDMYLFRTSLSYFPPAKEKFCQPYHISLGQ